MSDGLNTVPVLRMHLEELEKALVHCEGLLSAMDLQQGYRDMSTLNRPSRLTTNVGQQVDRVRGYLDRTKDEFPEE